MQSLLNVIISLQLLVMSHASTFAKPSGRVLNLPSRPQGALSGSTFINKIKLLSTAKREQAILKEILSGNIPNFERFLTPIDRKLTSGPYKGQTLRFWALPDYISVGSDQDFVIVPLNLPSIKILAEKLDLSLPTPKMVNDIYAQAKVKLIPSPLPQVKDITSTRNILKHDALVHKQLIRSAWRPGLLVAGHKKDIVQSRRLAKKPDSIAIYGWHQRNKQPIQPLSTVHAAAYADYSHGVRLVSNAVQIGTKTFDIRDVLSQKPIANLLSDEGVIAQPYHISGRSTFPIASK